MTHPGKASLTCEQFADTLADFLERDVAEPTRAAMETHALSCNDCGPLLADLRKLRLDAANMPELAPSRDLWAGIEARIVTPIVELPVREARKARAAWGVRRGAWIGLAAAALVAVTATITYRVARPNASTVAAGAPAPIAVLTSPTTIDSAPSAVAVTPNAARPTPGASLSLASSKKPSADQTFDSEIRRLRKIVDSRKSQLDTGTVAVIEKNLKIIDDAIAQCRAALAKDPNSHYLNESLNDALDNKVQLLRTAATLPVRM